jgi:hypothetical protein
VSGSCAVSTAHIIQVQVIAQAQALLGRLSRCRGLVEVDVTLADLVGTFAREDDHSVRVLTNILAQQVHTLKLIDIFYNIILYNDMLLFKLKVGLLIDKNLHFRRKNL